MVTFLLNARTPAQYIARITRKPTCSSFRIAPIPLLKYSSNSTIALKSYRNLRTAPPSSTSTYRFILLLLHSHHLQQDARIRSLETPLNRLSYRHMVRLTLCSIQGLSLLVWAFLPLESEL